MKLSKKGRYGLRALIDLAVDSSGGHVPLNIIAERNQIPPKYLEQVFASLRRSGIVKSLKGLQGGYLLTETPDKISISDILISIDGSYCVEDEAVQEDEENQGMAQAVQKLIIERVNDEMKKVLDNTTLEDLVQEYRRYQQSDMYYI